MSLTQEKAPKAGTITHQNGQVFQVRSDNGKPIDSLPVIDPSTNIRPQDVPGFKETLFEHHTQMLAFSRRMTRVFALALHLPEDAFDDYIKRPEAGMRVLHYP
ncbi:hypothetical protein BDZ45DRAFT_812255 [Acephala macrosclerotiorum]|nr:hypothetical protein BDZ45DRAFT_812255 [Acephala macrosclerotiorum]